MDKLAPLIVIEGIDGSGKGTQSAILHQRFEQAGIRSELLSFPRYQSTFFGARIGEFLNGKFGSLSELPPFLVSLLYAGDRFESREVIAEARRRAQVVVLDRYVPSNIAHQAAKADPAEREELRKWIEHVEYNLFQLPPPEKVILLDIATWASQELIRRKNPRSYTDRKTDLQESDVPYLESVRQLYLTLANLSPSWSIVSISQNDQIRSIDEIAEDIWKQVQHLIA